MTILTIQATRTNSRGPRIQSTRKIIQNQNRASRIHTEARFLESSRISRQRLQGPQARSDVPSVPAIIYHCPTRGKILMSPWQALQVFLEAAGVGCKVISLFFTFRSPIIFQRIVSSKVQAWKQSVSSATLELDQAFPDTASPAVDVMVFAHMRLQVQEWL